MTAKEQLLQEAPGWSEHDAEVALRAVEREHADSDTDEWGDISKVHEAAFAETMQTLAEEERAAGHDPW
jgi:hypothetical protein